LVDLEKLVRVRSRRGEYEGTYLPERKIKATKTDGSDTIFQLPIKQEGVLRIAKEGEVSIWGERCVRGGAIRHRVNAL
jgi:hypothetical protein